MVRTDRQSSSRFPGSRGIFPAILIACTLLAYSGTFKVPFVFDDVPSITDNPTIRSVWPIWRALHPPGQGKTPSGRPVLNVSLAVNYAISGTRVWSYHAANLLIHILAGLVLYGVVRRTVGGGDALGFAVALLWLLHPLQTESVTYVVQRAESLMGLFYLGAIYCFIRGANEGVDSFRARPPEAGKAPPAEVLAKAGRQALGSFVRGSSFAPQSEATEDEKAGRRRTYLWFGLSWAACLFGMGTKEVMVSAPVMVLLYDRTFVSGSIRGAWRRRRGYYLALASTWILLAGEVWGTKSRGGTAGFGVGVGWWEYAQTQFSAVVDYLRLTVWPMGQVFDYGVVWVTDPRRLVAPALAVVLLLAGVAVAWQRRPWLGFLGIFFFAILAPTSLVPGTRQTMAEHRMYLALVAVILPAAVGLRAWWGRRFLPACLVAAAGLAVFTVHRNHVYRSGDSLWSDTHAKRSDNPFACSSLGFVALERGDLPRALAEFEAAVRLYPAHASFHLSLGNVLATLGRPQEAIGEFKEALRIDSRLTAADADLGNLYLKLGRAEEAASELKRAVEANPDLAGMRDNLGDAYLAVGRPADAAAQFEAALRFDPEDADASDGLGLALIRQGRKPEAKARFTETIRRHPKDEEAHFDLGNLLAQQGCFPEAMEHYRAVLRGDPCNVMAHYYLGITALGLGKKTEAESELGEALRLNPALSKARSAFERARRMQAETAAK